MRINLVYLLAGSKVWGAKNKAGFKLAQTIYGIFLDQVNSDKSR